MAPAALELSGVRVRFDGLVALDDVSLEVPQDHVVGVIGPNGAGKTTLFNVVCGFVRPEDGELRRNGTRLHRHRAHDLAGLGIGRTLQGLGLFPGLTVAENVMVGASSRAKSGFLSSLFALPRADRDETALRERALEKLEEVGAPDDIADRLPNELSYGVQKRVALARALVCDPDLVLLDEPAAGLSVEEIDELAGLIRRLRRSVVLVEHHMDLVMEICDEVIVLDFGKVIARGTPAEIRDDPAVIDAYLGEEVAAEAQPGSGDVPQPNPLSE
jgi:branched-chain amino acid transport system ATP-binding protein